MMDLKERERMFYEQVIRDRSREQLAAELFGIYLTARAWHPDITDDSLGDKWPTNLHLADVFDKYVLPAVMEESARESRAACADEARAYAFGSDSAESEAGRRVGDSIEGE